MTNATNLLCSGRPFDAYQSYKEYVIKIAESVKVRNNLVKEQIPQLINGHEKDWAGKKVVIIQGTNHRETYSGLKDTVTNAKLSRTFLENRISFEILSEIESRIINDKNENIEDLIKKGFLAFYAIPQDNMGDSGNIARKMLPNEVQEYFNKIRKLQDFLSDKLDHEFVGSYAVKQLEIMGEEIKEKHLTK